MEDLRRQGQQTLQARQHLEAHWQAAHGHKVARDAEEEAHLKAPAALTIMEQSASCTPMPSLAKSLLLPPKKANKQTNKQTQSLSADFLLFVLDATCDSILPPPSAPSFLSSSPCQNATRDRR